MFRSSKKFVAVLMLLWLPLFSGNALATSIAMQMPQGACHENSVAQAMPHESMAGHHEHHGEMPAAADEHRTSSHACGVCHLACTGYLAVPGTVMAAVQPAARDTTPYLVSYLSVTSRPLLPPPLARA